MILDQLLGFRLLYFNAHTCNYDKTVALLGMLLLPFIILFSIKKLSIKAPLKTLIHIKLMKFQTHSSKNIFCICYLFSSILLLFVLDVDLLTSPLIATISSVYF
jgi:hypothetical protein